MDLTAPAPAPQSLHLDQFLTFTPLSAGESRDGFISVELGMIEYPAAG